VAADGIPICQQDLVGTRGSLMKMVGAAILDNPALIEIAQAQRPS
jgi:hypothetical protein